MRITSSGVDRLQQLWHTGSQVVVHGFSCFMECGIFPDQGLNLHWQVDSTDESLKSEIFLIENAVESGKGKYVDDAI